MKKLQLIALLLSALIMSMPVAFAQELSVTISGNDKANGNIRARDTLNVNAIAAIPGEDIISKEQIRLYYEDSFAFFDNCTRIGASPNYNCVFSDESFEAYQALQFRVELRNDDDRVVKSETKSLKVDALAPAITLFTVTPNQTISDVTIKYAAQDFGFTPGSIQECSGIKRVLVTHNGNTLADDLGQLNLCAKERQFVSKLNESGSVCVQAFDLVNQQSTKKCQKVIVDSAAPDIREPAIVNNKGITLTHVRKGQDTIATVAIKITDEVGVERASVLADLSAISPVLKEKQAPNRVVGDTYTWENVPIVEPAQCKTSVQAKDKLGNSANKEFACSIRSDNIGPVFKGVVSTRQRDNVPLYGRGTPLVLTFDEKDNTGANGIGLNRRLVYLDMSSIGLSKFEQADTCEETQGDWRCTWFLTPPKNTPEDTYTVKIAAGTADDLDNLLSVSEKDEVTFVYDDSPPMQPKIVDFKIIKGEQTGNITGAVAGNYVQYTVQSANFTDSFANFTDIGGKPDLPGICGVPESDTEGISECTFDQLIENSGPYSAETTLTFVDDAGNSVRANHTFEVLGVDNATRAKYWNSEILCTPPLINRATASLIPPYVSCRVHLTTKRTDIKPYIIRGPQDVTECSGDTKNILSDVFTTNAFEGSRDPIVVFKLEAKDYYLNTLNITCPITVISKRVQAGKGGYVSPNAQTIRVNLTTKFYNEPQRDMYAEVDRQIEKAMSDGLANAKWLGTLRQALYYFELLCRIKTIITSLVQVITMVTILLGFISEDLVINPFTSGAAGGIAGVKAALCGVKEGGETAYQSIIKVLELFCFFVNCGGSFPGSEKGTPSAAQQPAATPGTGGATPSTGRATPTGSVVAAGDPIGPQPLPPGESPVISDPVAAGMSELPSTTPTTQSTAARGGAAGQTKAEAFTSVISGGVNPLCRAVSEGLGMAAPNIKESLVWSVFCLCLPGIVYNVEKLRQVNCYKAVCLHDEVKERGYPVSYCEEMYQYNLCQYVVGQVWAALPFAGLADKITNLITDLVTNPVTTITLGFAIACNQFCKLGPTPGATALFIGCSVVHTLNILADAISSIYSMSRSKDLFKSPPGAQYCKRMEKIQKEMEKKEKEEKQSQTNSTTSSAPQRAPGEGL